MNYDIRRISHTLDVVLGRLEILEIRSKSAERSRVLPSSLLTSQGALEVNLPDLASGGARNKTQQHVDSVGPDPVKVTADSPEDPFCEIQDDFVSHKASLDKVIISPLLKVHDSRSGIKKEDQPVYGMSGVAILYVEIYVLYIEIFMG